MPGPDFHDIAVKWVRDTGHFRSEELQELDRALARYDTPARKPADLLNLGAALDAWVKKKSPEGQFHSHRNPQLVADLRRRVTTALLDNEPITWNARYPGILIANDLFRGFDWVPEGFHDAAVAALVYLESAPIGKALLRDISDACHAGDHKVVIEYGDVRCQCVPMDNMAPEMRKQIQWGGGIGAQLMGNPEILLQPVMGRQFEFQRGRGANAVAVFKHNDERDGGPDDVRHHIALGHELVHAYHYLMGVCTRSPAGMLMPDAPDSGIQEEEMRTVGFGKYKNEVPSENALRGEHNLAARVSYVPDKPWPLVQRTHPSIPRSPGRLKELPVRPAAPPALAHLH